MNSPAISRVLRRWALAPHRETCLALIELLEAGPDEWCARPGTRDGDEARRRVARRRAVRDRGAEQGARAARARRRAADAAAGARVRARRGGEGRRGRVRADRRLVRAGDARARGRARGDRARASRRASSPERACSTASCGSIRKGTGTFRRSTPPRHRKRRLVSPCRADSGTCSPSWLFASRATPAQSTSPTHVTASRSRSIRPVCLRA